MKVLSSSSIALLVLLIARITAANPDGPARSIVIEPTRESVRNVQVGKDVWRLATRLTLPVGSFITLRGFADQGRSLVSAAADGVRTSLSTGLGYSARVVSENSNVLKRRDLLHL